MAKKDPKSQTLNLKAKNLKKAANFSDLVLNSRYGSRGYKNNVNETQFRRTNLSLNYPCDRTQLLLPQKVVCAAEMPQCCGF